MSNQAPLIKTHSAPVQPVATAGNDLNTEVCVAEFAGTVTEVDYVPVSTLTGANTNSRTVTLVNKTQSTTLATLAFVSGVNGAAETVVAVTLATNPAVAAGDVLEWQSTHVGTGLADPGGLVRIKISRS